MKVLVTGGSGFVGSAVAKALASRGHAVVLPVRNPARVHAALTGCETVATFPLEEMSTEDWQPLLVGVDAVVHCAAIAHIGPSVSETMYAAINRDAAHTLAVAAKKVGVERFVFLSSIRAQVGPMSADVQNEQSPEKPTEAYGQSKLEAEKLIRQVFASAVILRPALVVGPAAKGNLATMLRVANTPFPLPFGAFTQPQAMVSLDGVVAAILLALESDALKGQTFVLADEPHPDLSSMLMWMREGLGRSATVISVPETLLALPCKLLGKGDAFRRMTGGLKVDASKLRAAGWQSPSTPQETFVALGRAAKAKQN
ncbi:MAG: NAD-dependent epimerase/dehydratase family protein [Beijerinckiaceae bacterium]